MDESSCVWSSTSGTVSIGFAPGFFGRLNLEAQEAIRSIPHRGLEIGGLLLGRRQTRNGTTAVVVEDFLAVECEHRSGPSYLLSEQDLNRLYEAVSQNESRVVGLFRTDTRSEPAELQEDDRQLFERFFIAPDRIFLLVSPSVRTASLFLPREGALTLAHEIPYSMLPIAATPVVAVVAEPHEPLHEEMAEIATVPEENVLPVPVKAELPPPQAELPMPAPRQPHRDTLTPWNRPILWWGAACAAALIVMFTSAGVALRHRTRSSPPPAATVESSLPAPQHVRLDVERRGNSLRLLWDQNSSIIREATGAKLYIRDGNHNSELDLNPQELQSGSLAYWPNAEDITFRLDVFSPKSHTSDTIRVAGIGASATPLAAGANPPETPKETANPSRKRGARGEASRAEASEPHPSPFVPVTTEPAIMPPPPAPQLAPPAVSAPAVTPPLAPAPAVASAYVTVSAEPERSGRLGRVVGKIPLIRRLRKHPQSDEPPKPLHEVKPALTAAQLRSVTDPVDVDVKVMVGKSGKVEYAELLTGATDSNHALVSAAFAAAREWEFVPAHSDSETVPAEMILRFRFQPSQAAQR